LILNNHVVLFQKANTCPLDRQKFTSILVRSSLKGKVTKAIIVEHMELGEVSLVLLHEYKHDDGAMGVDRLMVLREAMRLILLSLHHDASRH
jgi:hypothetical protein